MAFMYNMADVLVNISDAEGFGLSCMESLACETPAIVNMTGGLQEQITDGEHFFGVGIQPASKAIIGSQQVPFIAEDRVSKEDFINALLKIYNMPKQERSQLGKMGREHLLKNYNAINLLPKWDQIFTDVLEKNGSWEEKQAKNKTFKCMEV